MNPGVVALDKLVESGTFSKGTLPGATVVQYFPVARPISHLQFRAVSGLIHTAARWVGTRGLSTMTGRVGDEVFYVYRPEEDR